MNLNNFVFRQKHSAHFWDKRKLNAPLNVLRGKHDTAQTERFSEQKILPEHMVQQWWGLHSVDFFFKRHRKSNWLIKTEQKAISICKTKVSYLPWDEIWRWLVFPIFLCHIHIILEERNRLIFLPGCFEKIWVFIPQTFFFRACDI